MWWIICYLFSFVTWRALHVANKELCLQENKGINSRRQNAYIFSVKTILTLFKYLISFDALFVSLGIKQTIKSVTVSMRTRLTWFINTGDYQRLPVTGKKPSWSGGNYLWLRWPEEKSGHSYYNSPDTLLATVRKGQTESSIHQATEWTQGHIQHLGFPNNWCPLSIGIQKSNAVDVSWKQLQKWTFTTYVLHVSQRPHAKNKQQKIKII